MDIVKKLIEVETFLNSLPIADYDDICKKEEVTTINILGTDISVYEDGSLYYEF